MLNVAHSPLFSEIEMRSIGRHDESWAEAVELSMMALSSSIDMLKVEYRKSKQSRISEKEGMPVIFR